MPYTPAQIRLFQAKAHGWKPSSGIGPSAQTAQKMLDEVGGVATRKPISKAEHLKRIMMAKQANGGM